MNPIVKKSINKRWTIENIKNLDTTGYTSDVFTVDNLKWKFQFKEVTILGKKNVIGSLVYCSENASDPRWICDIKAKMCILRQDKKGKSLEDQLVTCLYAGAESKGIVFPKLARLKKNGFIKRKSIIVKVEFQLKYFDFSREVANYTDLTIRAKNTAFHVNKGILCSKSELFYDLFVTNESAENVVDFCEVPLPSVCYFLASCYANLDSLSNVAEIVQIASVYGTRSLLSKCEQFLIASPLPWSLEMKIEVAEAYNLEEVMTHSLNSIKTSDEIKKLRGTAQFAKFNEATKVRILNRLLDLI